MELFEAVRRQLSEAQDEVVALRAENERIERAIENFAAVNTRLRAENERLTAKCNRMCRSAAIEDIHGRRA